LGALDIIYSIWAGPLDRSIVANHCQIIWFWVVVAPLQLVLESFKVSQRYWVYGAQNIPVYICGARRSCDGSFIHPAVLEVNELHEVAIGYQVNPRSWVRCDV